jgi:hypothetical protein
VVIFRLIKSAKYFCYSPSVVAHVSPSTAAVSDLDCGAEAGLECPLQPSLRLFRCPAFLTDISV